MSSVMRFTMALPGKLPVGIAALNQNTAGSWAVVRKRHPQLQYGSTVNFEIED